MNVSASRAVTVVIPTHARRDLVLRTVASVLAQRDCDVGVVVVDDGSRDGTSEALRTLDDPRVTVLRHEQARRVNAARNTGVAIVTTPWVAFCDDDDVWAPDKLAAQLDALAAEETARWACVGAAHVNPTGTILRRVDPPATGDVLTDLARRNVIPGGGSGVLAATDLVRAVGGFDERFQSLSDWDLWLRLAARSPVVSVPRHLVAYLVHSDSLIHDPARTLRELHLLEAKTAHHPEVPPVVVDPTWSATLAIMALRLRRWSVFVPLAARSLRRRAAAGPLLAELVRTVARRTGLRRPDPLPEARDDESWVLQAEVRWADRVNSAPPKGSPLTSGNRDSRPLT
ncbi:glycosyltransferase family 2 protein [Actinomycetospora termitidis]|uniref:Glycosyltransferase n=1 Tax=Actinomycetospora termitidis TaxID=3053470 RepID=A0ABT7MEB0_9PSEU|nr:glycosyltransferase [Actinomycetospora sp. Odt1-22]MDL5159003.1 glycosyltransferase [Actinomycetospora sp. Odt1-22]